MSKSKAIVVLTNFWDANALIDYGFLLHKVEGDDTVHKVNLITQRGDSNFSVKSIALSHPPLVKLPHLKHLDRLDYFCPTYDILCRYKDDGDWVSYTKDYYELLKSRKDDLRDWLENLEPNHVYFLCCWENTVGGAECHRKLLYKRFMSSPLAMTKMLPIYRAGNKIYKEEKDGVININMSSGNAYDDSTMLNDLLASIRRTD